MSQDQHQPVQPRGGTGTPPHGQVTPQGPAVAPTVEERLEAAEARMARIETMVGETGGRIGETLIALIERHNWMERVTRAFWDANHGDGIQHDPFMLELRSLEYYIPEDFSTPHVNPDRTVNPVAPKVDVPETLRPPQTDTEEETEESSE